ncbi:hypothetical protein [Streptomyces hokutonensis]
MSAGFRAGWRQVVPIGSEFCGTEQREIFVDVLMRMAATDEQWGSDR